ncbi:MAG: NAD(P)/FAD-dependent oxidoreductase [Gammaproteobacteria bacterium]|nr:NAD(P)/FAD-dependent oxidoreductase [Gammaproteobacteria bacterium]
MAKAIQSDCVIIGAGPVGLFQVFELGLLGISAHLVDSLRQVGGQCSELYPDKPIYDIPAIPVCGAQELIDRLLEQIKPFNAETHLGQEVNELRREGGGFHLGTSKGTVFHTRTVVIAGGLGSFQPRRLRKEGVDQHEGKTVHYKVQNPSLFHGKRIAILGGGDSALDWTLELGKTAAHVTLVHRREEFRAAPASVAQMKALVDAGRMDLVTGLVKEILTDDGGGLGGLRVKNFGDQMVDINAEHLLVFYGLAPKLGPIADWGLGLDKNQIEVNTETYETTTPGIFAVGDINTYPGKKKLILSGFHEAALAAFGVQKHLNPDARQFVQYTTTSPLMHKRLGVGGE